MSKKQPAKKQPALPQSGGSWTRDAQGALKKAGEMPATPERTDAPERGKTEEKS